MPRSKHIWVFGSWNGKVILDNSKYLFLSISNDYSHEITAIWISQKKALVEDLKEQGYRAHYAWSLRGMYYCLRAGFYFVDQNPGYGDIFAPLNIWLSGMAKVIQLWHGLPLKEIGCHNSLAQPEKSSMTNIRENINSFLSFFEKPLNYYINKYVVTTKFYAKLFASAFNIPECKVIVSGCPRNDTLLYREVKLKPTKTGNLINKLKFENNKIVFYVPTFRDTGGSLFDDNFDLAKMEDFLEYNNCILILKNHHNDKTQIPIKQSQRLLFLPQDFDLYEILALGDILITDYSSIFFDFLLVNKPIIFFAYDLQKYRKSDRAFYFDYEKFVPGPIVYTLPDLFKQIENFIDDKVSISKYSEKRQKLAHKIFGNINSNASEDIFRWIMTHE